MSMEGLLNNLPSPQFNRANLGFIPRRIVKWRVTDLALLAVLVISYFFIYRIKPFHRQFYINDITLQHPFAERETVNNLELFIYSTWVPLVIALITSLILTKPKYKVYNTYVACLGLLLAVLVTSNVTDILKNLIGRHRPDFLSRCKPDPSTPKDVLVSIEVCTSKDTGLLEDGYRTTPSGHSSIGFAGLVYLALFLMGQFQANSTRVGSWRTLLCGFTPLLVASFIALSRTEDYRHHFVDVFIGSMLGLVIGSWSYLRLFPWISNPQSYSNLIMIAEEEEDAENRHKVGDVVIDGEADTMLEDV
ncbi:Diacylglycerol pyrophosphate phosphatase 1 [Lodderomyces elongisporus]|uniref:Phosphatidic acid phosphatase type 2/haloperoxidase domain-containing protein n=1 Tax=Lodderomyces elongisporus (strain ATCC 11503 / CBS 2605 / JCM 1781 / NBRC 1676 / NRRL YB-4239) TaxID=379508 RepID=A5E7J9_LODEL|nr:Diacylglycerol pyrophosphate phosphatase 1 [Lodderomyces elongisporus]EDK47407.1 hypothetical protein LELG_05588 [Lodderomyces elongisporus NRRL YB-4239]WLF81315.1 Diacylglycerol pyrophosphate phosphatase 1 [Lodderomyces elongisporus]